MRLKFVLYCFYSEDLICSCMNKSIWLYLILLGSFFVSCNSSHRDERRVVMDWMGQELHIPELEYQIKDIPIQIDLADADFKIINYVDSTGCISCRLKLQAWDNVINEFASIDDIDIKLLTIIHANNKKEVQYLLKLDNFLHPVAIDCENAFFKYNQLPERAEYHTFLLDSDNKILAIGNPVANPKIKQLYANIINGENGVEYEEDNHDNNYNDDMLFSRTTKSLGVVYTNDTVRVPFNLENRSNKTYSIQALLPSCDCTSAKASVSVIPPDSTAIIEVEYKPDSIEGSFRQYIDVFFNEKNSPERLIIYGYTKSS